MSDPLSPEPPPPPPPPPPPSPPGWQPPHRAPMLGYRTPGIEPRSQWWTDEDAYAGCLIYGMVAATVLAGAAGALWWLGSWVLGW